MKTRILLSVLLFAIAVSVTSCVDQRSDTIPYTEAHNYFFNNDATIPTNPVVTTQADFDKLYGAAAYMGKGGMPTKIDFSKQFVIGIVLPVTTDETTIVPGNLLRRGDTLTMNYRVKVGERNRSFSIQPVQLIVVDSKYQAKNIVLHQIK